MVFHFSFPFSAFGQDFSSFGQVTGSKTPEEAGGIGRFGKAGSNDISPSRQREEWQLTVHVLGEIERPGTYKVPYGSRVFRAIEEAGGIKKGGSHRNVELRRVQEPLRLMDLLRFELFAELEENLQLRGEDIIYVPLLEKAVEVRGSVRRPGIFELKNENTVEDVLLLSGGTTVGFSHSESVKIIRFNEGKKKVVEFNLQSGQEALKEKVFSGDVLYFPSIILDGKAFDYDVLEIPGDNVFVPANASNVYVLGGVVAPGPKKYNPYFTANQYLSVAGGTSQLGIPGKIELVNQDGKVVRIKGSARLNPGDTIRIPEKTFTEQFWLTFFISLSSVAISAVAVMTR